MIQKIIHYIRRFFYTRRRNMLPSRDGGNAACGQDVYIAELLSNRRDGIFVDIGANDGVTISNTLYFEKNLGWKGLAIEPMPAMFQKLKNNRTCQMLNACITKEKGRAKFIELTGGPNMLSTLESNATGLTKRRIRKNLQRHKTTSSIIEVDCLPFEEAMNIAGITQIDFLSVDTEGGELDILKSVDFRKHPTKVISVENNYYTDDIREYLESQGFSYAGTFKVDEIYFAQALINIPDATNPK